MSSESWKTSITKIEPNKISIHGYRVQDLMGQVTFPEMIYLLIKGDLPPANTGKMIDAILVSSVDHGVTPPSCQAAITVATTGAALNACLASGILAVNEFHGGAIEKGMQILQVAVEIARKENLSVKEAANRVVKSYLDRKQKIMGYGHRFHTADPRTTRLFQLAEDFGFNGPYLHMSRAIQQALQNATGKNLPINVDGAIAAVLCELQIPAELANAFFIMARLPGLIAHVYEEKTRYKPMRQINFARAEYDGTAERDL
jgi:citrate synthase